MTNRAAAMRYARALLDVSEQDADPERVERELSKFVDLMTAHAMLRSSLVNPSVPPSKKRALMGVLIKRLGDLSGITRRLLMLLAERDRLTILEEILEAYRKRLADLRRIVRAKVTTVSALPDERVQAIARALEIATGKEVQVETGVDTALVGGMVTQIGSTVYDGSIARHLERLRHRFLSQA